MPLSRRLRINAETEWSQLLLTSWWTVRDSNPGPTGYEPAALPTELAVRIQKESRHIELWRLTNLAPQVGLEPTTPRLTAACSTD